MGILLLLPLVIITFIAYKVLKPLSNRRTMAVWLLGIALFAVAGFTGFMFGDVNRLYSMSSNTYTLIKSTNTSLATGDCNEATLAYNDAVEQMNSGTTLNEVMDYISKNLKD